MRGFAESKGASTVGRSYVGSHTQPAVTPWFSYRDGFQGSEYTPSPDPGRFPAR